MLRSLFLLCVVACTLPLSPARVAAQSATVDAYADGLLWKVSRRGARDSFVFGTPAIGDARLTEIPASALDALAQARVFARPADWSRFTASRPFELARFTDGTTLRGLLGADDFARLVASAGERKIDAARLEPMQPWAALIAILPPIPADPIIDGLTAAAAKRKLKTVPLEFAQDQANALASVPREAQLALLRHAASERARYGELSDGLAKAWESRSPKAMDEAADRFAQIHTAVASEARRALRAATGNATVQMKHRLTIPLRQGGVFVAVSGLHLYGKRGLLALLAQDGYRIERLW